MENVYKVKIRSNPNPQDVYPSERRYSSSIVLGLSVMYLALAVTSSLMGTLVIRRMTCNHTVAENLTEYLPDQRLVDRIEEDLALFNHHDHHTMNIPTMVSVGVFIMSLGHFLSGFSGLLAWKQWYIDHNITWFFLSSCFSTVTSSISLLLISLALMEKEVIVDQSTISLGLVANIFITSLLGVVWSVVAANVAFKGMKRNYPDDLVLSKGCGGKIEVSTVLKGNKLGKLVPPDIWNNFPKSEKLTKFFPNKEIVGLPKMESSKEYEERVKQFLAGNINGTNET